jgi:hypothetical protein
MSQAKVDQYKKEKANRKKIMAREKAGRICARICAWVVIIGIVGWAGYTGYQYYETNKPTKTYEYDATDLDDYLNGLDTEAE